jgi:hypothetical protein
VPAFKETTQFEHITKHYTKSHQQINPFVSLECFFSPGFWKGFVPSGKVSRLRWNHGADMMLTQSITPVGPLPHILGKGEEVNAAKTVKAKEV